MKKYLLIILVIVFCLIGNTGRAAVKNVWGWAWSENVGWISFNCFNENACAGSDYKVTFGDSAEADPGLFSGYAWSENVGWVSFNKADLSGCPTAPCEARMDLSTGIVSGWAKPLFDGSASNWIKLNPTAAGANGAHLVGNEFEGWAFGGANSNDEAIVGLISFNSNTGGGAARYRVLTDFVVPPANEAPEAAISCENPIGTIVPCEIFQGDTIFLVNKSTDDVAITQSRWYSQYGATPYILQNTCVFCNYTPALGLSGAPDFQDYTIKLDVSDGTTTATATKLLRVKRGLNVDFQCSLTEGVGWGSCDDISPMDGDTIYLRDASQPSYSGIISSRIWHLEDSLTDANFGSGAFAPQILFTFPDATVSLNVTDSNGQDGNASHAINGTMRLPTWKEVSPAW